MPITRIFRTGPAFLERSSDDKKFRPAISEEPGCAGLPFSACVRPRLSRNMEASATPPGEKQTAWLPDPPGGLRKIRPNRIGAFQRLAPYYPILAGGKI
nr:hypothetical protein [Bacillaceae bacterium]